MKQGVNLDFGISIAYVAPGFIVLLALSAHSPSIQTWFSNQAAGAPTVGGFLFGSLASLCVGLTLSTLRWLLLDRVHHRSIPPPSWDFDQLQDRIDGFQFAVENHYRYYQFYGNSLMAFLLVMMFPKCLAGIIPGGPWAQRFVLAAISLLFFFASRDALRKYYARAKL